MALTLKELTTIQALAEFLVDWLPGSGRTEWHGHISFKSVAEKVGVGQHWQAGSKRPMLIELLRATLEQHRGRFERLVIEIVHAGIAYRQKQGKPVRPEDIDLLNGHLLGIGFKFPDLWDPELQAVLRVDGAARARELVGQAAQEAKVRASNVSDTVKQRDVIRDEFFRLHGIEDRQKAGLALEAILNRLFALEGLSPREPFRVTGEEIDGSFDLDQETYLVEAKWEKQPLREADLLVFRGKVEGKSSFSRGVLVTINGVTPEAGRAITTGKQPNFFAIDGYDITMVLSGDVSLNAFLRQRRRLLAEAGRVVVPYQELWNSAGKKGK
jgi:hypothetical protein